ncbi:MAG: SRPBCC family protein [Vicinamibacterales bacterium]
MARLDVSAQIDIPREPTDIASIMFDPAREPEWVGAVRTVEVVDAAIAPGARVRRTGTVLGREVTWTTAVAAFHFPHLLELTVQDGPFVGVVRYEVGRIAGGSLARITCTGDVPAAGALPASLVAAPMRSALEADLARLKALLA